MTLAILADVEARLGRPLDDEEKPKATSLLDEASDLVIGYLGSDPSTVDGVPETVARVVSRMAARVLLQDSSQSGAFGVTGFSETNGDYSVSRQYQPGSTSGGPWLTASDKLALKPFRNSAAFAVDTAPGTGEAHSEICALVFGANYCSCGAILTGSLPLYG